MEARHLGTVIWFDTKRGYGFLSPDVRARIPALAVDKDLFVHFSQIESQAQRKNLYQGQRVEFDVMRHDEHGVMAAAVSVI